MRVLPLLSAAALAVSVSALAPSTARGQVYLGLGGGASVPVSNLSNNHSSGYNVLASLGAQIPTTPVGVRVDGMFDQLPGNPGIGNAQIWTANANLVVSLVPGGPVTPYLIGGPGYYNGDYHVFTTSGGTLLATGNTHANNFGLNGGGGVRVGLGGIGLFAEVRYHYIFAGAHNYEMVPISAGVRFGG
jgi:outer membrane protein with beta-barrel domain